MKNKNFFLIWKTTCFVLFVLVFCFEPEEKALASIIFEDNFNSALEGTRVGSTVPPGWSQWMADGISATHDSVTHYSGEVTLPGRGGTGKALKLWRHSNSWVGSSSYAGSLVDTSPGSYSDFYMRFYAKMPTAFDMTDGIGLKMWRFNTTGGEIYININPTTSGWYRSGNARMQVFAGSGWVTLLDNAQLQALWDGQWHAWQFRFNLSTQTVTFWMDGTQIASVSVAGMDGAWNSYLQHFPLGNQQANEWQSSWQAFEVDDFVMATTKAETDPPGGASDTTPPTSPTNLAAASPSQSSISVSWNPATDNVAVTGYIVERCQGSGCSNFTQVGTLSSSPFTDTGLTANTFYNYHVRATDGAGNFSGWSNVVGATTRSMVQVSCNTVTTTNFSQTAYNSYGAPFDAFQTSANLIDAKCNSADTHTINLTTGITGDTTRIVYTKGYWYDAVTTAWRQYTGTCTGALNGEWCQGSVSATITDANVSTASSTNPTYLVGMTCSVQGGSWKCGCRDTSCTNFSWQIQGAGL